MRDALRVILVAIAILVIGVAAAAIANSAGLVLASAIILKASIWFAALTIEIGICFFCVRITWLAAKAILAKV